MNHLTHSIALLQARLATAETVDERLDYARAVGILKGLEQAGMTSEQGDNR